MQDVSRKLLHHIIVAYEPVWAIGSASAMTPREVHEMSIFIRKVLRDLYGPLSDSVRVLYGGAVTAENAGEIVRDGFVSGLLVGRESLKPKNFVEIIKAVDSI
jgi:triosephosphate isomerase